MRLLLTVWFFYRKLLIPLSVASALIGALSVITDKHFSFQSAGISFLIFSPVFLKNLPAVQSETCLNLFL